MAKIAKKYTDVEAGSVTFRFGPDFDNPSKIVTVNLDRFAPEMQKRLALHGMAQVLGDEYAGADNVDQAVTALKGRLERLSNGDWRSPGGGRSSANATLAEALFRIASEVPASQIPKDSPLRTQEHWIREVESLGTKQKRQLRTNPKVVEVLAAMAAERAKVSGTTGPSTLDTMLGLTGESSKPSKPAGHKPNGEGKGKAK